MEDTNTSTQSMPLETLYINKDYEKSITELLKQKAQYPLGQFHYILGTLYIKKGDLGAGRYNLEKAIKEGNLDNKVLHNLDIVKQQIASKDLDSSNSFYDKALNYSLEIPDGLYLSFTLLLGLFFLIQLFRKKFDFKKGFVLGIFISLIPLAIHQFYLSNIKYAILLKEVPIYEGPSSIFPTKANLKEGSKIIVGEKKDQWFFIKGPIELSGWVKDDNLAIL